MTNNITPLKSVGNVLLNKLLGQITKVDFYELEFPKYKSQVEKWEKVITDEEAKADPDATIVESAQEYLDKLADIKKDFTLARKHYVVHSISEISRIASKHNWDLCKMYGKFYIYNGTYWEELVEEELKQFLGKAAMKMGTPPTDTKHYSTKDELLKQFIDAMYLKEPNPANDKVLVNLSNGTLEISESGVELRDFNKKDYLMYQLEFDYNPLADAPMFKQYIEKVLPDISCRQVLAEYIGYLFLPNLKLEKGLLLYGSGANGKSVFFEIIKAMIGDKNMTNYSLSSLTDSKGQCRANIANKLVNYATEISGKANTTIFKQLVSNEPVEARYLYKSPFTMERYARLIFNCNHLPQQTEHNHAYFRRLLIIPFEVTIPANEQDKTLADKIIKSELPGVLNWVLAGLNRLLKNKGFTESRKINEQIEAYKRQSDNVALFIEDNNYVKDVKEVIALKTLYTEYAEYCNDSGYRPVGKKNFKIRMENRKFKVSRRSNVNVVFIRKSITKQTEFDGNQAG